MGNKLHILAMPPAWPQATKEEQFLSCGRLAKRESYTFLKKFVLTSKRAKMSYGGYDYNVDAGAGGGYADAGGGGFLSQPAAVRCLSR